ncbi:hypothetical protein [Nocardia sp. XZ_19_369]|uniref:hypothetical protein n=1 Tax=Nocardia sp. XZ_19_369 TaxID=2769487 RepID=UPI001E5F3808|nr:hypothetical protein [Nocardia sp. XZ_19_369]
MDRRSLITQRLPGSGRSRLREILLDIFSGHSQFAGDLLDRQPDSNACGDSGPEDIRRVCGLASYPSGAQVYRRCRDSECVGDGSVRCPYGDARFDYRLPEGGLRLVQLLAEHISAVGDMAVGASGQDGSHDASGGTEAAFDLGDGELFVDVHANNLAGLVVGEVPSCSAIGSAHIFSAGDVAVDESPQDRAHDSPADVHALFDLGHGQFLINVQANDLANLIIGQ